MTFGGGTATEMAVGGPIGNISDAQFGQDGLPILMFQLFIQLSLEK